MRLTARIFDSIQARLLAVFLVITLVTVVIVVVFNQWIRVQLTAGADSTLQVSAAQIAERIDEFHRSNLQTFNVGSRLIDLVEFLEAGESQRLDSAFRERVRITLDSLEIEPWDEYYLLSQAIIDRNGVNVLDTLLGNIGADESDQDYFRAALLGGSINISAIQYRPERSGINFYYAVPIRDETPPNTVVGVLRIQVSVSSIQNIVFDSVVGEGLNVAIFDENFVRVVDTRNEDLLFRSIATFTPERIETLRRRYALPPLPDDAVSVPIPDLVEMLTRTQDAQVASGCTAPALGCNMDERLAIIKLETVPWYLVVSQPVDQLYQTVQRQTAGILILVFSLTVVALAGSYYISRRITEPIRSLTAVAEQVAEGALDIQAPITTNDEVGTLARTFNQMTLELGQAHHLLEDRVEQRTRELLEANEKLKHEIEERQRYEKQALHLALEHERRRILSDFIQKASHEFKTPLSIINVNSYMAKRFLPVDKLRHMEEIESQGRYIEGLINRMVLMTRLDSGVSQSVQALQIDDLVRTVYNSKRDAFRQQQAEVQLDLQAPNTWVSGDPELLFIAVQHLVDNALNHSEGALVIGIRTDAHDGVVSITIEDNGVGIPEALQSRVFERFFRADEALTTRGFGLGLPIAWRIVENIGGTIELDSEVGTGTRVTITLGELPPED
jgi:signal transduction histidine kinase